MRGAAVIYDDEELRSQTETAEEILKKAQAGFDQDTSTGSLQYKNATDEVEQSIETLKIPNAIVHGDIKPENVLIDQNNEPKLCDFGLSRFIVNLEDALTTPSAVAGTSRYMAPERLSPQTFELKRYMESWNPKADIFSFGMLLYYMLAGHFPFHTHGDIAALALIVDGKRPSLADDNSEKKDPQ
ncbi:kinase-like protein [Calocera cornea HHB12733]|uniref:mitogen-activated protein kinase kinase n=1 Tax=Calocera cornea HHB12733 TaxID=1353952 RepID=A0A165E1C9_9BASI|nr:kinase-like protein [Calocera cornea HHB12733]